MAARTPSPPPFQVPHNTPGTCHVASSNGETNPAGRSQAPAQPTLSSLLNILLPTATLAHPPQHTRYAHLTPVIAELSLYPPLEAALHLLNSDLASAHFLVRHMNGPPAVEGMLLHSILHRSEGDFNNARAWLVDVRDACEGWVPKQREQQRLEPDMLKCMLGARNTKESLLDRAYGNDSAEQLIDDVEKLREKSSTGTTNETTHLEERIRNELEKVIEWCRSKFGDGKWVDASSAWVRPGEEVKRIGNDMVSGNKGWRKF